MTKNDCKMIACVYAMKDGCVIGEPKSKCAYYGDGTCAQATCKCCSRENTESCENDKKINIMREVKYRAWSKINKCMYYLTGFKYVGKTHIQLYYLDSDGDNATCTVFVENIILEQFTGLYDNKRTEEYPNGQPIYDGDIVKSNKSKYKRFNEYGIYEVYFNDFLCHYALIDSSHNWNRKNEQYDNYSLTGAKAKNFEVIGNIHNKESKGNV